MIQRQLTIPKNKLIFTYHSLPRSLLDLLNLDIGEALDLEQHFGVRGGHSLSARSATRLRRLRVRVTYSNSVYASALELDNIRLVDTMVRQLFNVNMAALDILLVV